MHHATFHTTNFHRFSQIWERLQIQCLQWLKKINRCPFFQPFLHECCHCVLPWVFAFIKLLHIFTVVTNPFDIPTRWLSVKGLIKVSLKISTTLHTSSVYLYVRYVQIIVFIWVGFPVIKHFVKALTHRSSVSSIQYPSINFNAFCTETL